MTCNLISHENNGNFSSCHRFPIKARSTWIRRPYVMKMAGVNLFHKKWPNYLAFERGALLCKRWCVMPLKRKMYMKPYCQYQRYGSSNQVLHIKYGHQLMKQCPSDYYVSRISHAVFW